ncbi:glycosyltransferase family 4 protein [Rhodococcus globerulus]|uniref:glycosyltransferase family 4 protein n=1 Tax=Rhodococcus globerulus TaxID=33008 RepID=UPI0039ECD25A
MDRIIYCHTDKLGGAELAVPGLARSLEATVWLSGGGPLRDILEDECIDFKSFESRIDSRPGSVRALLAALTQLVIVPVIFLFRLRRTSSRVVISNSLQGILHMWLGCFLLRKQLYVYVRDLGFGGNRSKIEVNIYRLLCRFFADGVIYNSEYTEDSWSLTLPAVVIPTPVRDEYFDCWQSGGTSRVSSGKLVMVGRVSEWKGQARVAEAFMRIHDLDIELAFMGDALFGESIILDDFSSESITSLGHIEKPWSRLHEFDVLIHASYPPEPFGQVLAQAAAAGMPILCADVGGQTEWLVDKVNCLMADPNDIDALENGIRSIVSDPAGAMLRAKAARREAERFRLKVAYEPLVSWIATERRSFSDENI